MTRITRRQFASIADGFWPIVVGRGSTVNDLQTTGKLSQVSREVLDIMWTVQREDGGWNWPHCDYAQMEIDGHYGVTVAALATGIAAAELEFLDSALCRCNFSIDFYFRLVLPQNPNPTSLGTTHD